MKKSVLFLLCCLLWTVGASAQHSVGVWKNGVPTIITEMDSLVVSDKGLSSPYAVGIWKDGIPHLFNGLDSIVFSREDAPLLPDGADDGQTVEPTEEEIFVQQLSADENNAVATVFTPEEKERYDAMAEELLTLYAFGDESRRLSPKRTTDNEYAQEALTKGHDQKFENLIIQQYENNIGMWGPSFHGGFRTFFTCFRENGSRYILVVFWKKGGFENNKRAYVKLGQPNNGKVLGKRGAQDQYGSIYVPIAKGQEYAYQRVCIDEYLPTTDDGCAGCISLFPLIITENNGAVIGQRNYMNPIFIKTDPIMNGYDPQHREKWGQKAYGYVFGTINNVAIYCNTYSGWNLGGKLQCPQLPRRYVTDLYGDQMAIYTHAELWPDACRGKNGYTVYENDGSAKPIREGDIIVWDKDEREKDKEDAHGHIGVVIRAFSDKISIAHQNGGANRDALAIGTVLEVDRNGVVWDHTPGTKVSPIYQSYPRKIKNIIRVTINEGVAPVIDPEPEPVKAMSCDATSLDFGELTVGEEKKMIFNVTNTGEATLTMSSVSLEKGAPFTVSDGPQTLAKGNGQGYTVTFKPTKEGTYTGKITIRTDAANHPEWTITLTGKAGEPEPQWGEKKMICSGVSDNTQYTLYKQPNMAKYRTNSAGTKFYQTRLIVDVTYQGVTVSSPVTSDVYVDPNGAQSIMALTYQGSMDSGMGMLVVFTSSKAEGNNNLMNGYAYMTGYQSRTPMRMFFSSEQTEHVFENKNYGWYPTFFYDDSGTLAVRHFCPDNNKIIESYYDYPVWESYEMGTTTKSDYENFWKNLHKPQFLEQPDMPWY